METIELFELNGTGEPVLLATVRLGAVPRIGERIELETGVLFDVRAVTWPEGRPPMLFGQAER